MTLEFDEQNNLSKDRFAYSDVKKDPQVSGFISFLIRHHIVKNEKSARIMLLILAFIILIISAYFIFDSFKGPIFID